MGNCVDVVVIGSGIVGASCAFHLARRGLSVSVFERERGHAMGSSGKSAAGVRVQFTTEANVALSMASLPVYREFEERHGLDVGYQAIGYLLLVPTDRWDDHLKAVALQRRMGAPVEVVTPEEAQRWIPFDTTGLAGATFGPWDGVVDPHMATGAWVTLAKRAGAKFFFESPIQSVEKMGSGWRLHSSKGCVDSGWVVNAAGAWAGEIGAMAGAGVPVVPKRVQIFLSGPVADQRTYPLTIDLRTGVYARGEGDRVLFGLDNQNEPAGFSEGMDWDWLEHVLMTGVDRFPWFEDLGVDRRGSWWGYYEVTPDNSPIIGAHPAVDRWIDASGFSGHGIMHAPVTGQVVSEIVVGKETVVDLHPFRHGRFGEEGAKEGNVF